MCSTLLVTLNKPGTQRHTSATSLRKQTCNLYVSNPRHQTQDGAHEMCRLPKSSSPDMTLDYLQSRTKSFHRSSYPFPSPGRSVTRARRLYVSRLANSVKATPNAGQCTRMCTAASEPRMAHLAGTPLPRAGAYTVSLLCVVSTERCVTQVPDRTFCG